MFTPSNSSSEDWFSGEVRIRFRPVMGMHYVNKSTHRNDNVNIRVVIPAHQILAKT